MLMKVEVENYMNNYEQGGMQLDPTIIKTILIPPPIKQEIQTFDYKKESIFNNKKRNKSWHGTGSCSSLGQFY